MPLRIASLCLYLSTTIFQVNTYEVGGSANGNAHSNGRARRPSRAAAMGDGPLNSVVSLHDYVEMHPSLTVEVPDPDLPWIGPQANSSSEEGEYDPDNEFVRHPSYGGPVPTFDMTLYGTDAGWYDGASDQDRDLVIRVMNTKWPIPYTTLGLWQTALQVRQSINPNQAALVLDSNRLDSRVIRSRIRALARETFPTLTWEQELEAEIIKEQLCSLRPMISDGRADNLILAAFKYEGMDHMPAEVVVQHILYKLDSPDQFAQDQIATYRGLI